MSGAPDRVELEAELKRLFDAGDLAAVTTRALEAYGGEIYGLLRSMTRNDAEADDAWGTLGVDLWRGIPQFEWRSSLRTWSFALARRAAVRVRSSPGARAARNVALSESPVSGLIAAVRSRTAPHLRTDVKDAFAEIRRELEPEDQLLLVLRVDEGLSWDEAAEVMDGPALDATDKRRRSARLRQRFQTVKDILRRAGEARGLLGGD